MTAPNFVGSVAGLFGSLLHDIFTAVVSSVISGSVSPPTPPVILPPPRSRFVDMSNIVIGILIAQTIRRPQGFLNIVNGGTSGLAYGIRRILHFRTRPTPIREFPLLDIESGLPELEPQSGFVEAVRNFFYEEPLTEETWRDSILLAIIMISITYGARYITYIQNRRLLGRLIPDQPGPSPFSGVEITARDGRIVLSITPLALYMGCTIVIIAVIWTIWISRRSSTGSHDNSNGSPKNSRR